MTILVAFAFHYSSDHQEQDYLIDKMRKDDEHQRRVELVKLTQHDPDKKEANIQVIWNYGPDTPGSL